MSNAQMHILAGTISSFVLAFILYQLTNINIFVLFAGVVIGIIASEFPDIDHPKSLPRKVMRGLMPAIILFIFAYLFLSWRLWSQDILIISLFMAAPIMLMLSYEYFIPKHRGATHKWPGMAVMICLSIPFVFAVGTDIITFFVLTSFAVIGFSTHILLDHL